MTRAQNVFAIVAGTTLVGFGAVGTTIAGPFDPAYRGDPNSVHAIFDEVGAVGGIWDTTLFATGPSAFPLDATVPLAGDDGLDMRILLPNFIDNLPQKLMRIQLIFNTPVSAALIGFQVVAFDTFPTVVNFVGGSTGVATAHFIDFEIFPNPDWEEILIFGDAVGNVLPPNLTQIEIDTVSQVPSPGTIALSALGGVVMLRRRR